MSEKCWHRDPSACKCKENARIKELEASEAALRKRVEEVDKAIDPNSSPGGDVVWAARNLYKNALDAMNKLTSVESRAEYLQRRVDELVAETRRYQDWAKSAEKERDEAVKKYHAEIKAGRERCEGIVKVAVQDLEKRLAALTAPTGEKEIDHALLQVEVMDAGSLISARHPKVLAATVRSMRVQLEEERRQKANVQEDFLSSVMREKDLRGKLDEACTAFVAIVNKVTPVDTDAEAQAFDIATDALARIRGGR